MDDFIYDSRSEALDKTAETLAKVSDLPNQVLKSLGEKANLVEEKEQASDETLPRHLQRAIAGRVVIRNDILLSLETFLSLLKNATKLAAGIAGIATPGGIAAPAGVAALTDGLYGLYKFYTEIVAK